MTISFIILLINLNINNWLFWTENRDHYTCGPQLFLQNSGIGSYELIIFLFIKISGFIFSYIFPLLLILN